MALGCTLAPMHQTRVLDERIPEVALIVQEALVFQVPVGVRHGDFRASVLFRDGSQPVRKEGWKCHRLDPTGAEVTQESERCRP